MSIDTGMRMTIISMPLHILVRKSLTGFSFKTPYSKLNILMLNFTKMFLIDEKSVYKVIVIFSPLHLQTVWPTLEFAQTQL